MDFLRTIIRRFDDWLSRREGVAPFTDDPRVILRLQIGRASHDLLLPDGTVPRGTEVLLLHAWNERMPLIPAEGPDLAYGLKFQRPMLVSLKAIAQHIQQDAACRDVQAVGGITAHASFEHARGGRAMLQHLGFTIFPYHRPLGAFGEFWENFYTWWLMWTFNPASLRHRTMWGLQRTEFWMTKEEFLKLYGT